MNASDVAAPIFWAFLSRVVVEEFWAVASLHETNWLFVETFGATVLGMLFHVSGVHSSIQILFYVLI